MAAKRRGMGGSAVAFLATALKPLSGGSRGMLFAIALLSIFFILIGLAWQRFGSLVVQDPKFQLTLDKLEVTESPAWVVTDVKKEAFDNGSLEGLSLLDQQTIRLVEQSFTMHAWVEEVVRASKTPDGRVEVSLRYRRPVIMVAVRGGYYPIDSQGVVLPTDGFSEQSTMEYLQFYAEGLYKIEQRLTGSKYGDDRVIAAAQIAHALGTLWRDAGLVRIDVYRLGDSPLLSNNPSYELATAEGRRVVWGSAPGRERNGELSPADKVSLLARYVQEHGPLEGTADSPVVDLTTFDGDQADVARRPGPLMTQ